MREIEFRGKRLGSGEWVYGDLIVLTMGAEGKPKTGLGLHLILLPNDFYML